jgi:hypothetical protein
VEPIERMDPLEPMDKSEPFWSLRRTHRRFPAGGRPTPWRSGQPALEPDRSRASRCTVSRPVPVRWVSPLHTPSAPGAEALSLTSGAFGPGLRRGQRLVLAEDPSHRLRSETPLTGRYQRFTWRFAAALLAILRALCQASRRARSCRARPGCRRCRPCHAAGPGCDRRRGAAGRQAFPAPAARSRARQPRRRPRRACLRR